MEVLAPVGSMDSLKAAILGGADSVYLGGREFGARRLAKNFTDPQLKGAVSYAHDNDVRVYVASNILVKEDELKKALSFVEFLDGIEADAVILQDRGLLGLVRDHCSIAIHASTQMGIHSSEGVEWCAENGISRVILARELSLDRISKIKEDTDLELEVFVHGALCYSVSGQCLFSSMVGGRSGNRGLCAQPCRLRYCIGDEDGYPLSTADLFAVGSIPRLMEIGVACLKIEGRMRSPLYAFLTSLVYKRAVERASRNERELITYRERELLEVAFNRGFTPGYLEVDEVMQKSYPDSRGKPICASEMGSEGLCLDRVALDIGDGITLYRSDDKVGGFEIAEFEDNCGKTYVHPPFPLDHGRYDVYKTKDREFDHIVEMISSIEIPEIPCRRKKSDLKLNGARRSRSSPEISCYVSSVRSLESVLPHADRIYFELNPRLEEAIDLCRKGGIEIVPILPRVSPEIPEVDTEAVMASTLGQLEKYKERVIYGHYSLNFFNSITLPRIHQYTLSVEMTRDEMRDVLDHHEGRLEALAFGRVELMVTKDPTLREGVLADEAGRKFPVYRDRQGYAHILNSADLLLLDYLEELEEMGVDSIGLDLRRRDPGLCEMVAKAFKNKDLKFKGRIRRKCGKLTSGHYLRGVA